MDYQLAAPALVLLATLLLTIAVVEGMTAYRERLRAQLRRHNSFLEAEPTAVAPGQKLRPGEKVRFPLLEGLLSASSRGERMRLQLLQADVKLRAGEYQAVCLSAGAAGVALGSLMSREIYGMVAGAVVGYMLPAVLVSLRRGKRLKALNGQVVECLELIATSLRSGFSFLQGLEAVRQEMDAPLADEIGKTLREISLGSSTEDALNNLGYRTGDADLALAITAVLVQRRVGGNLAEVLTNISHTLRERIRIRGEVNTLTAQARGSGMIVGLLPVGLAAVLFVLNPAYVSTLVTHPTGRLMLGAAVLSELVGIFLIRKMIEVDF